MHIHFGRRKNRLRSRRMPRRTRARSPHVLSRCFIITVALVGIVPLSGVMMLGALLERDEVRERLTEALEDASTSYRDRAVWSARKTWSDKTKREAAAELLNIGKQKRALRKQIVAMRSLAETISGEVPRILAERSQTTQVRQELYDRIQEMI